MIDKNVFNTEKTDYTNPSLFFGQRAGIFDTVNKKYPEIWDIYKTIKSLDWDEGEFNYSSCVADFKTCDKSTYEMMIKTLAWQWEADSFASRISPLVGSVVTSSELWAAWQRLSDQECLTASHEVYTKDRGWVHINEIEIGDVVLQYTTDGGLEFTEVLNTISKPYSGDLYKFSNRYVLQETTENHRMMLYMKYANNPKHKFVKASEVPNSGSSFIVTSGKLANPESSRLTDMDRLWIAFQADGTYPSEKYTGGRTGTIPISFTFKKERKKRALMEIVERLGLEASEHELSREGYSKFYVNVPVNEIRKDGKTFGWVDPASRDFSWCRDFVDELYKWDGCDRSKLGGKCLVTYTTTSEVCKDLVRDVAAFAGYSANVYTIPEKAPRVECYQVTITDKSDTATNAVIRTREHYEGDVHCITVESGAFLTKNGDRISVTGNCIHAATYSEIVRNSFEDPSVILDEILSVEQSLDRLETVSRVMSRAHRVAHEHALGLTKGTQEEYNAIFMFAVGMLVLERIQFMSSFAVTFAICDTGLFQPIGKAVQKIAQDEFETHVELDKAVIRNELKSERGNIAFEQCREEIEQLIDEVLESEFSWVDYLFSEGRELIGLNADILKEWSKFCARDVVKFMKVQSKHKLPTTNPLKFMENWLNIGKSQGSPQEEDIAQYKVNVMRRDDDGIEFDTDF